MALWEQVKGKTQAVQIKLRMLFLENQIDQVLLRLGSRTYDLNKSGGPFNEDGEVRLSGRKSSPRRRSWIS